MNHTDALTRLAACRANQPDAMQVVVASEIVDALLNTDDCDRFRSALERIAGAQSGVWGWVASDALTGRDSSEKAA